jgi:hypothetical protein
MLALNLCKRLEWVPHDTTLFGGGGKKEGEGGASFPVTTFSFFTNLTLTDSSRADIIFIRQGGASRGIQINREIIPFGKYLHA